MSSTIFKNNIAELEGKINALKFKNSELKINALRLRTNVLELKTSNQLLSKKAEWLETELAMSKHYCALLKNSIYGKRSEKSKVSHTEQMSLLFNEAETYAQDEEEPVASEDKQKAPKPGAHKKGGRKGLPKDLPREKVIHKLEQEELQCKCGSELVHIGSDISEQLDIIPAKVIVKEHVRYKYACKSCEEVIKRAPPAFTPLNKSIATSNLLAHICTQKFDDHSPLYRQERIWQRLGVSLSRATMSNWLLAGADLFKPMITLLKEDINKATYACSDETTINVLNDEKSKNYMWLHMSGARKNRAIVYEYNRSRTGEAASNFLKEFKGYHQCDGYSGYNELHQKTSVTGVGCMAHARRKFMDIVKVTKNKGIASDVIDIIGKLYDIEKQIIDLNDDGIYQIRQKKSKPIIEELKKKLLHYKDQAPPTSILGKAINYPLNQWSKLIAYLEDGRIRIDNNDCERAIKPFVIGRKNWLFSKSQKGAEASSIIYSIIETCKANNVNTYNYLRYLFENIHKAQNKEELRAIVPYNIDASDLAES
jgi:transposase